MTEQVAFGFDIKEHLLRLEQLERKLESAFESSSLQEYPDKDPINDLLVRIRLGNA